jgi:peptide/nickel transport system permease protein
MRLRDIWRESGYFRTGIIMLALVVTLALLSGWITNLILEEGKKPLDIGAGGRFEERSWEHPLGTGVMGRDILVLTVVGLRYSLIIGAMAGAIATAIGVIMGFVAGYKGGVIDSILRTTTDMFLVIPSWPLLATLSAYIVKLSVPVMALLLAIFSWPFAARAIRSQVMSLRDRPYVELAKISGLSDLEIIFQEILPNLLPYLGAGFANSVIVAILAEVGLEVIGLAPPGLVTLGLLINWGIGWGSITMGRAEPIVVPALLLVWIFLALNLINIGLEQTYNPRLKKVTGA